MFARWLVIAPFLLAACRGKNPESATNPVPAAPVPSGIVASPALLESKFIREWIELMQTPALNITATDLAALCARKAVSLDLGTGASCEHLVDVESLTDSFETGCVGSTSLYLKLRPKVPCQPSVLAKLRQRPKTGPLLLEHNNLQPNTAMFPLLAQVPPILFTSSSAPQLVFPPINAWLKSMSSTGALRVFLRPSRAANRWMPALSKVLSNFDSPKKFSPQIKWNGTSAAATPSLGQTQIVINWEEGENLDPASRKICEMVTGWIDFNLLNKPRKGSTTNLDLSCVVELENPAGTPSNAQEIEIGRLNFPIMVAKSGAFLFTTLSEALTPSALLGLRLDL